MRTFIIFLLLGLVSPAAYAKNACDVLKGQIIKPKAFEQVIENYTQITPRGKFESSAQFEDRRNAILDTLGRQLVVGKYEVDTDQIDYDADTEVMSVSAHAFSNMIPDFTGIFFESDHIDLFGDFDNYKADIRRTDEVTAAGKANKVIRTEQVVFDRRSDNLAKPSLFAAGDREPAILGRYRVPRSGAERLISNLKIAFYVEPKEPYLLQGAKRYPPNSSSPDDVMVNLTVLFADIRCGLLLTGANKVIGAYPTR